MDLGLTGATAVVTGGSKGMGLAIAETLGAEGASVALMARGQDALEAAAEAVAKAGAPAVLSVCVDMADGESIAGGFAEIGRAWGALNVLVHTVGPDAGAFEDLTDEDWKSAFDLGALSAVRSVRSALPILRAAEWARVVTLAAHSIQRQSPRLVAYTAAKSALASLTKNLSKSLGPEGILVNCVCPGTIVTASFTETLRDTLAAEGLNSADPHDVMRWVEQTFHHPCDIGRAGLPEEIASVTTYLASRRNTYITGATVNVDGGSDFI
ncbi:SDR family oxidoreductase [Mycolicibacterium sp. 120266]|uniref:SDR family NAD(P)-dependent oxidoreductase n=1 Tax=Mycolicibacterium sp. 120266 TaxID=3090601 RepID=UPI00299D3BA0|nr:SDR family oxidoreductase [Mycolicibacterium sp. 120266]MDX1873909.1 SDR family oxidoreductase [Mycolicibacterium sp. 120266]